VELFDAALARMRKDEGEAVMLDVTAHAHVYGRPAGSWAFETVATKVGSYDDVWARSPPMCGRCCVEIDVSSANFSQRVHHDSGFPIRIVATGTVAASCSGDFVRSRLRNRTVPVLRGCQ
jgi:hypothetical protein